MSEWTLESIVIHFSEKFRMAERWEERRDAEFAQFKSQNNEWRGALRDQRADREAMSVTRAEWNAAHSQLRSQMEADVKVMSERIDTAVQQRGALSDRLIKIESRTGYVNVSVIGSVVAMLMSVGLAVYQLIHGH